jgi:hypothetical protein
MCEAMTKAHRKMSVTASHRIVSLTERSDSQPDIPSVDDASAEIASNFCPKHPDSKQEVFDILCGVMLCTFCLMEHRECFSANAIQSITEASSVVRESLQKWDPVIDTWSGHVVHFSSPTFSFCFSVALLLQVNVELSCFFIRIFCRMHILRFASQG